MLQKVFGIDVTIIRSVKTRPFIFIRSLYIVVVLAYRIDILREHSFQCNCQRERNRQLVIQSQRRLPDLWHLEVRIYTHYRAWQHTFFRTDSSRKSQCRNHLVYVRYHITFQQFQAGITTGYNTILISGGNAYQILNHTRVGRHICKEHQRNTPGEES